MRNAVRWTLMLIVAVGGALAMQGTAQAAEVSQEQAVSTALARAQKFGTVESVGVALRTAGEATAAGSAPGESESTTLVESATQMYYVTVKGRFSDYLVPTPRNAPTPTGTEMTFTIEKATGFVLMIGLSGQKVSGVTAVNIVASQLIVTVIGVDGHRHKPLHNAAVRVEPGYHHSHPLFRRLTDRHGRAMFDFAAGRYEISASRGNRLCAVRNVTLTGETKRVTLTCHLR